MKEPVQERPSVPTGTETILVVDDQQMVLDIAQKILVRLGYQVLLARDGREAVEIARNYDGEIHLALLDLTMPRMGGSEAYPLLMRARPQLKVLVCSGYELDSASQALLDAGASAFVQKPFRLRTLASQIRESLDE